MRLLLPLCFLAAALPLQADSKEEVRALLEKAGKEFMASVEGLSPEQWNFQAPGEKQTIGSLAEHTALSTNELQIVIQKALNAGPVNAPKETEGKTEKIKEVMFDEENPPENFRSQDKLVDIRDIKEFFPAAEAKLYRLLEGAEEPEKNIYKHPSPKLGTLNALQWFYYIAYLNMSHTQKINKIKQHAAFPAS